MCVFNMYVYYIVLYVCACICNVYTWYAFVSWKVSQMSINQYVIDFVEVLLM